jgi:phospholipid/cholesterol/gamma-HCH transport system substrate-binding protein
MTGKLALLRSLRSVVVFVLPALGALVVVAAVIAWKQDLFVSRTPIYIMTDSALGITKGIPVKVFGLTIGAVDEIEIMPSGPGVKGQVRIRLSISSEYLQHITRDSKAKLMREAVVGQSLIEIRPGEQRSRPVGRNEQIAFERGKSLGELSEELNKALAPVLAQAKEAFHDLQRSDGRVQKSLDRVTVLLDELPESNRKFQRVLTAAERTLTHADATIGGVDRVVAKAEGTVGDVNRLVADVANTAPSILKNVDAAAQAIARTAESAQRVTDDTAKRVPVMLDGGNTLIRDANQVMSGAKSSWPLNGMVTPPAVTTLGIDSNE